MRQFKYLAYLIIIFALSFNSLDMVSQTTISYEPIVVDAGDIIVTYVNSNTNFIGNAFSMNGAEIIKYEWDFNGDDIIDYTSQNKKANYIYKAIGNYKVKLVVTNSKYETNFDFVQVQVKEGKGEQESVTQQYLSSSSLKLAAESDGINNGRAVLINGGYEQQFWDETLDMYTTLKNVHCFSDNEIILLNYNGKDPSGNNPNGIIDYAATNENVQTVFNNLSNTLDGDDVLLVWYTNHGNGYVGSNARDYGSLGTRATIDPGDEQDYLESNFKLRSFYNGLKRFGMDQWAEYVIWEKQASTQTYKYHCYREKYVSRVDITLDNGTHVTDNDIYIEHMVDYMDGDLNKDGWIDEGEHMDYENNKYAWIGLPEVVEDNYNTISTKVPGTNSWSYILFDKNFDNQLDIDINPVCTIGSCSSSQLVADGTDVDNDGLFDGIDANQDGDKSDWISIDEVLGLYGGIIYDDELKALLNNIPSSKQIVIISACMSGGFVDDLSAPGRVIITAAPEEYVGIMGAFMPPLTNAFKNPSIADVNNNGVASLTEAFNYAAKVFDGDFQMNLNAQYDDNGDMISHVALIPNGNDGSFGSTLSLYSVLLDNISLQNLSIIVDKTYKANNINLNNVTIQNNSDVKIHAIGTTTITNSFNLNLGSTFELDNNPKCQ